MSSGTPHSAVSHYSMTLFSCVRGTRRKKIKGRHKEMIRIESIVRWREIDDPSPVARRRYLPLSLKLSAKPLNMGTDGVTTHGTPTRTDDEEKMMNG